MFERVMEGYGVDEARWAYKLAPYLTAKAQQAYVAMNRGEAEQYGEVKKAILRRYDINEETYRQRFRGAKRKDSESYVELATHLDDLAMK